MKDKPEILRQRLVEALRISYERYRTGEEIFFLNTLKEIEADLHKELLTGDLDSAFAYGDDFSDAHFHRTKDLDGRPWPEAAELLLYLADCLEGHKPIDTEKLWTPAFTSRQNELRIRRQKQELLRSKLVETAKKLAEWINLLVRKKKRIDSD